MGRQGGKGVRGAATPVMWEPSPQQLEIYARVIRGDKTQQQVAKEVGRDSGTISRLVGRIDRWLAPQWMDNIRQIKANHTSRLMHIYREAMSQWEKSKIRYRATKQTNPIAQGKTEESTTVEIRSGDPKFLQVAADAMEQIRLMWGMNAPEKMEGETLLRVGGLARSDAIEQRQRELDEARADSQKAQEELDSESGAEK